jgi:hypothetical protein
MRLSRYIIIIYTATSTTKAASHRLGRDLKELAFFVSLRSCVALECVHAIHPATHASILL